MPRGEFGGDQPAVRHAGDDRAIEAGAIEREVDLGDVVLERACRIARERTGPLVAQRET